MLKLIFLQGEPTGTARTRALGPVGVERGRMLPGFTQSELWPVLITML